VSGGPRRSQEVLWVLGDLRRLQEVLWVSGGLRRSQEVYGCPGVPTGPMGAWGSLGV